MLCFVHKIKVFIFKVDIPSQALQSHAFRVLCDVFQLIPTPQSFLFYYNTHPSIPVSWFSLSSRTGNVHFAAFTTSYNFFKEKYFKIFVELDDRDYFYTSEGQTKFLFTGLRIQLSSVLGRNRLCRRWISRFWWFLISSLTNYLLES